MSPKRTFGLDISVDVGQNFGQALPLLEQALWHGHPTWTSMTRLRVWKTVGLISASPKVQARKRNPHPNFWVRISSGGVGVFHVKGWGPKSSACPAKPGKPSFFRGISWDFAGISQECPKSLRTKQFVFIFRPLKVSHKRVFTLICWQAGRANTGFCSTLAISSCGSSG